MTDPAATELPAETRPGPWRRLCLWYRNRLLGPFDPDIVLERVLADSGWSGRYALLIALSAGIAVLGLLLSSPAVIIGAMLMAPMSGPALGLGFALFTVDWALAQRSMLAMIAGALLTVLLSALLVLASPLKDMTPEILARTRPNMFDLLVALFAGLAGGYVAVRGRGQAIVGVAIATALLPPLAVVGFGIATANLPVLSGSFALFLTNFLVVALSAGLVARFYGFGATLAPRQTKGQLAALLLLALLLATPLFFSLRQIGWEALAWRSMRSALDQEFGGRGRITSLDPNFSGRQVVVRATILTDRYHDKAATDLERRLREKIGRPVKMELSQVLVNQGDAQTELDRARSLEARNREDRVARADMAARLSLVSGVPVAEVLVDPIARIATAQVAGGQSLLQLMQAEARLADDSPGWSVKLLPPAGPLPPLNLDENGDGDGGDAEADGERPEIAAVAWALARLGTDSVRVTVRQLTGETRARAVARGNRVAEALRQAGLIVELAAPLPPDRALERDLGTIAMRAVQLEPLARSSEEAEEAADDDSDGDRSAQLPPVKREA